MRASFLCSKSAHNGDKDKIMKHQIKPGAIPNYTCVYFRITMLNENDIPLQIWHVIVCAMFVYNIFIEEDMFSSIWVFIVPCIYKRVKFPKCIFKRCVLMWTLVQTIM